MSDEDAQTDAVGRSTEDRGAAQTSSSRRTTWAGSVRWADAASPEAWMTGTETPPRPTVEEPRAEVPVAGRSDQGLADDDFSDEDPPADDPGAAEDPDVGEVPGAAEALSAEVAFGADEGRGIAGSGGTADDDAVDRESLVEISDFARRLSDDPRTGAMPIIDIQAAVTQKEADATEQTIYELRTAAQRLEEVLIGGKRVLTRKEVANLAEVSTASARKLWRALGQPRIPEGEEAFTVSDAAPLRRIADLVSSGLVDEETALQMARAIGQMTDRLVVWQMEAMVEYLIEEKGLSDSEARRASLDVFEDLIDPLQDVMVYAWRRNLAGALGRLNVNVEETLGIGGASRGQDPTMPLARGIGFIDLVSYTRLSQQLDSRELGRLVKHFQFLAYNIVAAGGGKVIKTVGDEVFFAAETPLAGAEIAMTLLEQVRADESLPKCRVGYAWGRVLSRMGDIFGTTVNLAARLTAIAEPSTVVTDADTARILERDDAFRFSGRQDLNLQGLGEIGVVEMHRDSAPRISTEDIA